jgi:hypothetical protein
MSFILQMILIAQAAYHQANPRFKGAGRQCVANSYAAIQKARKCKVNSWTETDLNEILDEGDNVYQSLKINGLSQNYLLISDLQKIDNNLCIENADFGLLLTDNVPPYQNLLNSLCKIETVAFLTISCYTVAVIHDDIFYVFDPHSRDEFGLVSENGKAVLTAHNSVHDLHKFLLKLTSDLSNHEKICLLRLRVFFLQMSLNLMGFQKLVMGNTLVGCKSYKKLLKMAINLRFLHLMKNFLTQKTVILMN